MKQKLLRLTRLRALVLTAVMCVLGAGQAWAAEESLNVTLSNGSYSTDHIVWSELNGKITIQQLKGSSSTAVNSSYISAPRAYKGHIFSFTASTIWLRTCMEPVPSKS